MPKGQDFTGMEQNKIPSLRKSASLVDNQNLLKFSAQNKKKEKPAQAKNDFNFSVK